MELLSLDEKSARLGVSNLFMKQWISKHYLAAIQRAIEVVTGQQPEVSITISPRLYNASRQKQAELLPEPADKSSAKNPRTQRQSGFSNLPSSRAPRLNREFTLKSFVVGPSNRLAYDAALATAEQPSASYNPLFLQGGPGLGKTHLLQGICHRIKEARPQASILYMSCEEFTNSYIQAVQSGKISDFRNRCRNADCLVIDDVHFLAAKVKTQEEFFHTFDALHNLGRQIVLSSDAHPREIAELSEKLQTRFVGGLVAELDTPNFETRLEIVMAKAAKRNMQLPEQVAELVARRIDGSVRELEGAVATLCAATQLSGRPLDMPLARSSLRRLASLREGPLGLEDILKAVEKKFGVTANEIRSSSRVRRVLLPRQTAMYLSRQLTDLSLSEIGRFFGGRDHATVLYAERKIATALEKDAKLAGDIEGLTAELKA
jgi:chromosomal replication initiator protein